MFVVNLKTLKTPPKTIITTAYRDYAIEGYDLDILDGELFLRVHRPYIINLNKITAYTHNDIELGTIEVLIKVSYKEKIYSYLNMNR